MQDVIHVDPQFHVSHRRKLQLWISYQRTQIYQNHIPLQHHLPFLFRCVIKHRGRYFTISDGKVRILDPTGTLKSSLLQSKYEIRSSLERRKEGEEPSTETLTITIRSDYFQLSEVPPLDPTKT